MAASMDHVVRVKLSFEQLNAEPSWFCVSSKKCKCVSDIIQRIISKFDLPNKCIKLMLSDCILPPWESSRLLRDNDCLRVLPDDDSNTSDKFPEVLKILKIKKKKKKDLDKEASANRHGLSSISIEPSENAERDLKKRKHEIMDILNSMTAEQQVQEENTATITNNVVAKKQKTSPTSPEQEPSQHGRIDESSDQKKRKRKRKRKNKNTEQCDPLLTINEKFSTPNKFVENKIIKINLPYSKRPLGKHRTFSEEDDDDDDDDGDDDVDAKPDDDHATFKSNNVALTESLSSSTVHNAHTNEDPQFNIGEVSRDKQQTWAWGSGAASNYETPYRQNQECSSIPSSTIHESRLTNGAAVYTRKRMPHPSLRVHRGAGTEPSVQVLADQNKLEQLDSDSCLHSVKLSRQNENTSVVPKENAPSTSKLICKYSKFPDLDGPPRKGDKIAFKIIELTSSCTPEVSRYKEATVLCYDPITTMADLQLVTTGSRPSSPNRFSMDAEITGVEDASDKITVEMGSLLEAKLLIV